MGSTEYNCKIYHYVDGVQVRFYKKSLHRGFTLEREKQEDFDFENTLSDVADDEEERFEKDEIEEKGEVGRKEDVNSDSILSSMNRTIQSIYGISRSNSWDWFLTLTVNPRLIDSTDYDLVTKKLSYWLNNLRKRKAPDMKYILVPELHKDGKKWHFHALISDCSALRFKETNIIKNGKLVYNLLDWLYGFSTATKVEHSGRVSNYITKYITKELCQMTVGRRRYWASLNCFRMNDVMTIDYLTEEQKCDFIKKYSERISYMKTLDCKKSNQTVRYIEIEGERL